MSSGKSDEKNFGLNNGSTTGDDFRRMQQNLTNTLAEAGNDSFFSEHAVRLLKGLAVLWKHGKLCDCVLAVEKGSARYAAHKAIIACHCARFSDRIIKTPATTGLEIRLSKATRTGVEALLLYMYTSKLNLTVHNVDDVIIAAKELQIESATKKCVEFIYAEVPQDAIRVFRHVRTAEMVGDKQLQTELYNFIRENFGSLSETRGFTAECSTKLLLVLLSDDQLVIDSEMSLLRAVLRWVEWSRQERQEFIPELLRRIRYQHITPEQLASEVEPLPIMNESPELRTIVQNAIKFHALRLSGSKAAEELIVEPLRQYRGSESIPGGLDRQADFPTYDQKGHMIDTGAYYSTENNEDNDDAGDMKGMVYNKQASMTNAKRSAKHSTNNNNNTPYKRHDKRKSKKSPSAHSQGEMAIIEDDANLNSNNNNSADQGEIFNHHLPSPILHDYKLNIIDKERMNRNELIESEDSFGGDDDEEEMATFHYNKNNNNNTIKQSASNIEEERVPVPMQFRLKGMRH
ncbi:hypothetical protein SNEBB_003107 [Seison nebaliae]|nr:hypothetical protein SNEBB_003107 [Seison nebaliae]